MQSLADVVKEIQRSATKEDIHKHFESGNHIEVYFTNHYNKKILSNREELKNAWPIKCDMCDATMQLMLIDHTSEKQFISITCRNEPCIKRRIEMEGEYQRIEIFNIKKTDISTHPENVLPEYGIEHYYFDFTLDKFMGQPQLKRIAMEFIDNPKGNFIFTGGVGTGKTHIAVGILQELIKRGKTNLFFKNVSELLVDARSAFDEGVILKEHDIIDFYSNKGILVLDDLGAEKTSEHTIATLYLIIDKRLRQEKPTIITTNLSLKEIETNINPRIASRLVDSKVIKFSFPDFRKKRK